MKKFMKGFGICFQIAFILGIGQLLMWAEDSKRHVDSDSGYSYSGYSYEPFGGNESMALKVNSSQALFDSVYGEENKLSPEEKAELKEIETRKRVLKRYEEIVEKHQWEKHKRETGNRLSKNKDRCINGNCEDVYYYNLFLDIQKESLLDKDFARIIGDVQKKLKKVESESI